MLKELDQISLSALLAALLTLILLGFIRLKWLNLPFKYIMGLSVCSGIGFSLWFVIFNVFALTGLDFDWPIPLFPVSPEDLGCALTVGLVTLLYWLVVLRLLSSPENISGKGDKSARPVLAEYETRWWLCLLPTLAALIVDVYFI
jgi:hypothetical protein